MEAAERNERTQNFKLEKSELITCLSDFLQAKGLKVIEKGSWTFEIKKPTATSLDIESVSFTIKAIEERPIVNGA